MRHPAPSLLAAVVVLLGAAGCGGGPDAPLVDGPARSVLLLTLDTTRADRIGAFGGTAVPTPHLDRLAKRGVVFTSAISQVPLTLPAHSSILTSRYPAAHGVRHNGLYRLPEAEATVTERLATHGLDTGAFVGAYVLNRQYGTAQGFGTYDDIRVEGEVVSAGNQYELQRPAADVNAAFLDWLVPRRDGRWFAWLHYYDPHIPYDAPPHPRRELHGSGYDREISYVDACVGDLLDELERDGTLDETLVVVIGDHGESLGEHRELTHGVFLYEGAVRVPFIVAGPGVPRGGRVGTPVELVDVAPTILELLELEPLEAAQGRSLVEAMRRDEHADRSVFAETFMPRIEFGWSELLMVRDERYKYIAAPKPELYDLVSDPGETTNLVHDDLRRADVMSRRLQEWLVEATASAAPDGGADAEITLSTADRERLQSLGYLGGGQFGTGGGADLPDPKDRIDEGRRLTLARDMAAAGQVDDALRIIQDILDANPSNHLAHTSKTQTLIRMERIEEAERAAAEAVRVAQQHASASPMLEEQARRTHASTLWMLGRREEAEAEYRAALASNDDRHKTPVFGGLLLGAAANREEAERIVEAQLRRTPDDPHAWAARFELQHDAGEMAGALTSAERLAELGGGDPDTLLRAAATAEAADRRPLAIRLLELAERKAPENTEVLGRLGTLRLNVGRIDAAQAAFEAVRRIDPDDGRASFYLGNIALLRNDERTARSRFDEALRASATTTQPLLNLALWLAERGRIDDAIAELELATERNPDDPQVRSLLTRLDDARRASGGDPR